MNINIALNVLYQREITSREQLLNEMLRVKITQRSISNDNVQDKEKLFQLMKKTTEDELGFFPADREDFFDIYQTLKDFDLLNFTQEVYKDDRTGTIVSPTNLTRYITSRIGKLKPNRILITEAEKHLYGLKELIEASPNQLITLTTQNHVMYWMLKLAFSDFSNIQIRFVSIYSECLENEQYDYIYTLPVFNSKTDNNDSKFITRDSDGIAIENMLEHLDESGVLDIIVPAKITFASGAFNKLRSYVTENYNIESIYILPEGTFRPYTAIKTYFFSINRNQQSNVDIGTLSVEKSEFMINDHKTISKNEFLSHEDWRIELLMSEDNEHISKFKNSVNEKLKLKEVAEIFRGKSILKKDTTVGNISVLNLSNIDNGEIDYSDLDTINEEERKIKRYELMNNDVVLSCRGTAIKIAVFKEQENTIIASANLIVIRPKSTIESEYIKIFLESPIGQAMIKSFQRGTTVMNINHSDIMEMEIPLLSLNKQNEMITKYSQEWSTYKATIDAAEKRWKQSKNKIYDNLI
jgi:hypothetical protein